MQHRAAKRMYMARSRRCSWCRLCERSCRQIVRSGAHTQPPASLWF